MKDTHLIDQEGMGFIKKVFAKIGCIVNEYYRETGIDALIEIRESPFYSSGKLIGVQLKSGESYFRNHDRENFYFYADQKHINYWLRFCLPVILIIYNPSTEKAFWTKIDNSTLIKCSKNAKIPIPKKNDLEKMEKETLLEFFFGKIYKTKSEFERVFKDLKDLKYCIGINIEKDISVSISGIEIFVNSLLDSCTQIFFDSGLMGNIARAKAHRYELPSFSPIDDDFCISYLELLTYHNIIEGDFSFEFEILYSKNMYPLFIKPLSINGRRFIEFLKEKHYPIRDRFYLY